MSTPVAGLSKCTVDFLMTAANAAYAVQDDVSIPALATHFNSKTLHENIDASGYRHKTDVALTGPLKAAYFEPRQATDTGPIVIAFRGTASLGDAGSDLLLGVRGVIEKPFRDAAFQFYRQVKERYPNREIVLTGHSLGGHLATYVATKAYAEEYQKNSLFKPLIQVRTFNTAPTKTLHGNVFQARPDLSSQIVNYRTSQDVVSDLPLQNYYGNTFVFKSDKTVLSSVRSHLITAMAESIPQSIREQCVGTTAGTDKKHNELIESANGMLRSYHCRVDGQYFKQYRVGTKNLAAMKDAFPDIIRAIREHRYDDATKDLTSLKERLKGSVSTKIVDNLMKKVTDFQQEKQEEKNISSHQSQLKTALQQLQESDKVTPRPKPSEGEEPESPSARLS